MTLNRALQNDQIRELLARLRARSAWERGHADRVAVYSVGVGAQLGLGEEELLNLRFAAVLHDIGKLSWPDEWFDGRSPGDKAAMRLHPGAGAEALKQIEFLAVSAPIVGAHHERMDGSGYPLGLSGESIPLAARIVGACETFDVLANGSPWQPPVSDPWEVLEGPGFDSDVVGALRIVAPLIQPVGT